VLGKLHLVKSLLEKLEHLLANPVRRKGNGLEFLDTSEISTFLDTSLSEFVASGQVFFPSEVSKVILREVTT
jgi:hypothetical protein